MNCLPDEIVNSFLMMRDIVITSHSFCVNFNLVAECVFFPLALFDDVFSRL